MNLRSRPLALALLASLAAASHGFGPFVTTAGASVVLDAHFNDKTLGQPIGTGGAAVGEPTNVHANLTTEVIPIVPGDRAVRVTRGASTSASRVTFQLIDNVEVTTGTVAIRLRMMVDERDLFSVLVRESGGAAWNFLSLNFLSNGAIGAADTIGPFSVASATYPVETWFTIELVFDMDAGTSSAWIGDTQLFAGRQHGIADRGVGRVLVGYSTNAAGHRFTMDDVLVLHESNLPIFDDGFEPAD